MNSKKQVTRFVRELFDRYELNDLGFFVDYDSENDERTEIPLFPYTKMDDETLNRISVHTGLTVSEILSCDQEAAIRYQKKYPFISLYKDFKEKWAWYSRYKTEMPTAEEYLLNAIFTDNEGYPVEARYDYADVKKRMIDELKKADAFMPGTYHKDAGITNLIIETEVFFSFPRCAEMIRSFIDMVNILKGLFFKALSSDLEENEINELNFLASRLNATDIVSPSTVLNYENICTYRNVYIQEDYKDFFSYGRIRAFVKTDPWRCQEFFEDMKLVQEFVGIFPEAKALMREFVDNVTKFSCYFNWSDAQPIVFSDEDEKLLSDFNAAIGERDIPLEERAKEITHIFVNKNNKEMYGWVKYAEQLRKAAAPTSKGGLAVIYRDTNPFAQPDVITRIHNRVSAMSGGNKQ